MKKAILTDIIAALFILLFIYAAMAKLIDYTNFQLQLAKSPLIGSLAGIVAWIIPTIEIIISVLLSMRRFRLQGLFAGFSLMVMFTAYIIAITAFSEFIPCSCGGILSRMGWSQHLLFNLCFVLLAIAGILLYSDPVTKKLISLPI